MTALRTASSVPLDGVVIVYCDGSFGTPNGKTAHGLVRFTYRYDVAAVIDQRHAGRDARDVIDGKIGGIPVCATLAEALASAKARGKAVQGFVIGLAPDGGRLPPEARAVVAEAIAAGLFVDSGLHDFLSDDPVLAAAAAAKGVRIRDVRKTPGREHLHHFSSQIDHVGSVRVAVLGTDSAVGKRTTAWMLVHALREAGLSAEMIGTGQTGWMQGAKYSLILDSLINDFVSGELEHAVVSAWNEQRPDYIVVEGQGSLMNPAYPGGFEILAATRPQAIVLQHAPARLEYDGFPGFPIEPIEEQIAALELISKRKVVAITVNHEDLDREATRAACAELTRRTGLPAVDPLWDGVGAVVEVIRAISC